jgi:hypothetical protein
MRKAALITVLFIGLGFANKAVAQCDTIASLCGRYIQPLFVSDGQQYRSLLLNSEEYAEFHTTFFGETIYRIVACSGTSDGNLIFTIYDQDRRQIFTNKDHKNAPYWDFKVKSTVEVLIEARLDSGRNKGSGCAVILIGFKQK